MIFWGVFYLVVVIVLYWLNGLVDMMGYIWLLVGVIMVVFMLWFYCEWLGLGVVFVVV